ncbi:deoxyribonuclease [Ferrimonas sediminicola]|uniref:Deoxyribonuclease n=1 Tax=Ferrimonas sediminicola TaxID=2569538 RepID=A0A4U1BDH0_9GAMM|nr:endonuclease [Ferrimonas sediminicola]TKB48631.1 deoxyribonuclease [Ferrimonas sediminicola]
MKSLLFLLMASASVAAAPSSFNAAKKQLVSVYDQLPGATTFYCGCDYRRKGKKLLPDLHSCGYRVRKQKTRADRIEWEHVVPAWAFGHQLQCWQEGGRKNCRKDQRFKVMEADMHNLVPALGEVNGDRAHYRFSDMGQTPFQYGRCEMVVDFKGRRVQPPERARGAIARTYLYMQEQYRVKLSGSQLKLMQSWDNLYPVTTQECERHRRVSQRQGWPNPHVAQQCQQLEANANP